MTPNTQTGLNLTIENGSVFSNGEFVFMCGAPPEAAEDAAKAAIAFIDTQAARIQSQAEERGRDAANRLRTVADGLKHPDGLGLVSTDFAAIALRAVARKIDGAEPTQEELAMEAAYAKALAANPTTREDGDDE
ncbi:MAG: hypothetical protein KGZ65_06145 [Sphingomonadales bacterium]|nr:hypothetical protein [Sphingomonadaceae bacterium]MBS3930800.1 hypothetical protein [Sphingomonadales bacterium]